VELVDEKDTRLELCDALGVDVRADDIVSGPGETSACYQANITTTLEPLLRQFLGLA
jgi:hypothetical protein